MTTAGGGGVGGRAPGRPGRIQGGTDRGGRRGRLLFLLDGAQALGKLLAPTGDLLRRGDPRAVRIPGLRHILLLLPAGIGAVGRGRAGIGRPGLRGLHRDTVAAARAGTRRVDLDNQTVRTIHKPLPR
ncbi:MAG TPA: hypothetical protein PK636_06795, partial [bacterium]|nr:hypothetical protein [bacterium]